MIYYQFGEVMNAVEQEPISMTIEVERGHINDPGAVLYGVRTNSSIDGKISFQRLMISQPGQVQLKISMKLENSTKSPERILVYKFVINVASNPEMELPNNSCLFVFNEIQSPFLSTSTDIVSWNDVLTTSVVGRLPSSRLFEILSCQHMFANWAVDVHVVPLVSSIQGNLIEIRYRSGIEAILTGRGMPRAEMNAYQRLGVPLGSSNLRQIRSAYHKKSLLWHPDRWSGILRSVTRSNDNHGDTVTGESNNQYQQEIGPAAFYTLAVQEAFELVAEAYEELQAQVMVTAE